MKILHITNTYNNEFVKDNDIIKKIIYGMQDKEIKQEVIIPKKAVSTKNKDNKVINNNKIIEKVIPIWGLPYGLLIDLRLLLSPRKIENNIDINYDLIHAHSFISDGYIAYKLAKINNKPYVASITGTDVYEQLKYYPHLKYLAKKIYESASTIVSMSQAIKDQFLRILNVDEKKIQVVPNGVDRRIFENSDFQKPPIGRFKFVFIGKFIPLKNLKRTILAMNSLIKKGYDFEFNLIGYGREEKNLKKLVDDLKINNQVNFLGKIENKYVFDMIKEIC